MTASKRPFLTPPSVIENKVSPNIDTPSLPVKGGRQSVPDSINSIGSFFSELTFIDPDFPAEILAGIENLAKYHGDVSLAVENMVALGNTEYTVEFDDAVSDDDASKMKARLVEKERNWYVYSGGLYSLINDLLAQVAISGCISAENIPTEQLDGVKKVAFVAPKNIRFKYDREKDVFAPYQRVAVGIAMQTSIEGNMIPLNTLTYKYSTLRRFSEKPYPVPPFLSALFHINIERDMMENMKLVMKKLGVLGFLEVLVNAPAPLPNEDPDKYYERTRIYLEKVTPEVEKGMAKGYVTGFKDRHEFNMHSTSTSVQGAKDMVELNDQKMMAGLKQDPLMFGRNFSTTETLGRVILAKMTSQVANYQNLVATFLSDLFLLDLQLGGFNVKSVVVKFAKAMIGDTLKEEQTFAAKIENTSNLYNMGIIGQDQAAVILGYEKPDQEEPRAPIVTAKAGGDGKNPQGNKGTDPAKSSNIKITDFVAAFEQCGGHFPQYEYESPGCGCDRHVHFDKTDSVIDRYVEQYFEAIGLRYDRAVQALTKSVAEKLLLLGEGVSEQAVVDLILFTLYKDFKGVFTDKVKGTISKFVNEIYTDFRKDKSILTGMGGTIPNGAFSTIDYRAIDYYKNSDSFYLGKFITDEDLKSEISKYIRDEYLNRNLPIGNNFDAIRQFKDKFGDIMQGQDWKIRRIIDTTVNHLRNTAAVNYMNQAEVAKFEIRGVVDRLQCPYCKELQGKQFSVVKAVDKIDSMVKSDPNLVGIDSPFITSVFRKAEDMKGLSAEELQLKGIDCPPFHSHCRDVVVAIL